MVRDYVAKDFDFYDVKLAIGIALSSLGYVDASESVITFLGTNHTTEDITEKVTRQRDEVLKAVSSYEMNMIRSVLKYLWENKVLVVCNASSRTYNYKDTSTLQDLVYPLDVNSIYTKTMEVLFKYPDVRLLIAYIYTSNFKLYLTPMLFANFRKSYDGIRDNDLSAAVIDEIIKDFAEWTEAYSLGKFSYETGTPRSFLWNSFKTFYQISDYGNFRKILNSHGQLFTLGDSDFTYTDTISVVGNKENTMIDFTSICKRIQKASVLLFTHNNNSVAFYDIFSYHRDLNVENLKSSCENIFNKIKGYKISFESDESSFVVGFASSIAKKKASRLALCSALEDIIQYDVGEEDLCGLYRRLIKITNTLDTKEASRLFRVGNVATKSGKSNGTIFKILIEGYYALKELLNFLNSSANCLGVTVNSFPIDIFRDELLLRRFKTFEEYITYVNVVCPLVYDVRTDPERSQSIDSATGIYDNDFVFGVMSSSNFLKDPVFSELRKAPLAYFETALNKKKSKDETLLCSNLNNLRIEYTSAFQMIDSVLGKYTGLNLFLSEKDAYFTELEKLNCIQLLTPFSILTQRVFELRNRGVNEYSFEDFFVTVMFCKMLKVIMKSEDNPVCTGNDFNFGIGVEVMDVFNDLDETIRKYQDNAQLQGYLEQLTVNRNLRVAAIQSALKILFSDTTIDEGKVVCTAEDLRNLFITTDVLWNYFSLFKSKICSTSSISVDESYIYILGLLEDPFITRCPSSVTSISDFECLCEGVCPYNLKDLSIQETLVVNEKRDALLFHALNKLLTTRDEQSSLLQFARDRVMETVSIQESTTSVDIVAEKILARANKSILGSSALSDGVSNLRQKLKYTFNFDSENYAVLHSKRYCFNQNRCFIHKEGYVVEINKMTESFTIRPIEADDINVVMIR